MVEKTLSSNLMIKNQAELRSLVAKLKRAKKSGVVSGWAIELEDKRDPLAPQKLLSDSSLFVSSIEKILCHRERGCSYFPGETTNARLEIFFGSKK